MPISAALGKLMKFAKAFASELVGRHLMKFMDHGICKHIADEFRDAVQILEQARELLHLDNECCHQVVESNVFQQTIRTWEQAGTSVDHVVYMNPPGSSSDLSAANLQLKELNWDVCSLVRVYAQAVELIRRNREQAQRMARHDLRRRELQEAASNEEAALGHNLERVRIEYARWYPYVRVFCEGWSLYADEVEENLIGGYLVCCRETQETIREVLQAGFLNRDHVEYLNTNLQSLEDMEIQMRLHQEQMRRSKEVRQKEEEQENALREEFLQQSDEDFWEEYDRRSGRDLAAWERKLLTEEKLKRKLRQQRMQSEKQDCDESTVEVSKLRVVNEADWQSQRLQAHEALQQMLR
jgi:hypothetical protein